jgi:hypothetical protein
MGVWPTRTRTSGSEMADLFDGRQDESSSSGIANRLGHGKGQFILRLTLRLGRRGIKSVEGCAVARGMHSI